MAVAVGPLEQLVPPTDPGEAAVVVEAGIRATVVAAVIMAVVVAVALALVLKVLVVLILLVAEEVTVALE